MKHLFKKDSKKNSQPYWNPYIAGIGLGLTLLASFVLMGRGLGASGAFTSIVSAGVNIVAEEHANENAMFSAYIQSEDGSPLRNWLFFEILGVFLGAFISGRLAGRVKKSIVRGPRISSKSRLVCALFGGLLMGFAAKLARGCTSGQALSGGALLSAGSWIFMMCVFLGAYAFAYFIRREWT